SNVATRYRGTAAVITSKGLGKCFYRTPFRNARFNYDRGGMRCGGRPILSPTVLLEGPRLSLRDRTRGRLVRRTPDADRSTPPLKLAPWATTKTTLTTKGAAETAAPCGTQ